MDYQLKYSSSRIYERHDVYDFQWNCNGSTYRYISKLGCSPHALLGRTSSVDKSNPTPAPSTSPPTSLQRTLFTIHDNSYTAMATTIPDSLKSADIGRFVTRAAQIERAKPVIAYWCWCYSFHSCCGLS